MMSLVVFVLIILFLAVFLPIRKIFHTQEELVLRSSPLSLNYQYSWDTPHEELFFSAKNGQKINAILFKYEEGPAKGVIYYLHGRGDNLGIKWGDNIRQYTEYGYDVLGIDYRGFGKSPGPASEETMLEDVELGYSYLEKHYPEDQIIVYGQSLGTSLATYVASRHPVKTLFLEAPFYSFIDCAAERYRWIPRSLFDRFLRFHLRTDLWIKNVRCPVYIFHGIEDTLVPISASKRLVKLIKNKTPVELYPLSDWGHKGIMYRKDYREKMKELLR